MGTCVLIEVGASGDRYVIKREGEKILKYEDFILEIRRLWNAKAKVTGNNRGDWNRLKITHTVPEQRTGIARN